MLPVSQQPRVLTRPEYFTEESGIEAIELAESVGLILDPWQQLSVMVAMAETAAGRWAAPSVAQLLARQNGKGGWLEAVFLHGLFLDERMKLQLWTAHQFKTSGEAFIRIRGWIDGSDDLRRQVASVNASHGEEGFKLTNGKRLRFLARSKSSGRGFSPQRLGLDEAQELSEAAHEAMVPALSAQAAKHILYTGTVPGPEVNHPEVFTRIRDRGREGKSTRLAYIEYSPEGSDDWEKAKEIDIDDPVNWQAANPAYGIRIFEDSIDGEREDLGEEGFRRERLSIWPKALENADALIPPAIWNGLLDKTSKPTDPVSFAVYTSQDRKTSVIGMAARRDDGKYHVAIIPAKKGSQEPSLPGTSWVVPRVEQLKQDWNPCAVVVDGYSSAGSLIPILEEAGIDVTVTNASDMAKACGNFYDAVMEDNIRHTGSPTLASAVTTAKKRDLLHAWAWDRKDPTSDINQLVAVTLALHGLIAHGQQPQETDVWGFWE